MRIGVQMSSNGGCFHVWTGTATKGSLCNEAKSSKDNEASRTFGKIKDSSVSCTFIRGLRVSLTITHRLKCVICAGIWMFVFRRLLLKCDGTRAETGFRLSRETDESI